MNTTSEDSRGGRVAFGFSKRPLGMQANGNRSNGPVAGNFMNHNDEGNGND